MKRKIIYISLLSPFLSFGQFVSPATLGEVNHREAYVKVAEDFVDDGWFLRCNNTYDTILPASSSDKGVFKWTGLEPGYTYSLYPSNSIVSAYCEFTTPKDWQYRDSVPNVSFVTGSCSYINEPGTDRLTSPPYGGDYQIYENMALDEADFNLWLGDNIYLRPSEYSSPSGVTRRYNSDRNNSYLQMLLTTRPNYAIWDDHDAGPNDAVGSYIYMESTREAFRTFWPRAQYGNGSSSDLRWLNLIGDVLFIGLDNRTYRTSEDAESPQILGKEQIDWLVSQVRFYKDASFIVVSIGGQVLNSEALFENYAQYPEERTYLLNQLATIKYQNIVFFTGDRHHSEISQLTVGNIRFTDVTVSPLTSGVATVRDEEVNENRITDIIESRNYAQVKVTGKLGTRLMTITYKDSEGKEIYSYSIRSL